MDQGAGHAAIPEHERVARRFDRHATVGGMSIVPDIFAQRPARRIGPPRRALRRDIGRALRHIGAPLLAETIKPGNHIPAHNMIEDRVRDDVGDRTAGPIGEHRDAAAPLRQKGHQRSPADPAPRMADDPLAAVVMGREAKPVMALADFGELRSSSINARLIERLQPRRRNERCAVDLAVVEVQPHVSRHVRRGDIDAARRRVGDRPEPRAPAHELPCFLLVVHDIGARTVEGALQVRVRKAGMAHAKRLHPV
jgi:hypothetical protein